jgi:adenylyltransferase/sulfurtransferase
MVSKPRGILNPFGGKAGNNPHTNEEETDRLVPGSGGAQEGRRSDDEEEDAVNCNDDDVHIPSKATAVNPNTILRSISLRGMRRGRNKGSDVDAGEKESLVSADAIGDHNHHHDEYTDDGDGSDVDVDKDLVQGHKRRVPRRSSDPDQHHWRNTVHAIGGAVGNLKSRCSISDRRGMSYDDNDVNNDDDHFVLCSPSEHDDDEDDSDADVDVDVDSDDSEQDRAQYKDDYRGNRQTTENGNDNNPSSDYFQWSFKRKHGKNEYDLQLQTPLALQGSGSLDCDDDKEEDPWREKEQGQQDQEAESLMRSSTEQEPVTARRNQRREERTRHSGKDNSTSTNNSNSRRRMHMSIPGIVCGVAVNVVGGVSAAAQAVSNPETRRRLAEAIRYQAAYRRGQHGGSGGTLDRQDSEPLVGGGEGGQQHQCEPPPLRGNKQGEYALAFARDEGGEDGDVSYDDIIESQQDEIQRLKDRIFALEGDLNTRRHLDDDGASISSSGSGSGSDDEDEDSTSSSDDSSESDTSTGEEETKNVIECSTLIDVGDDNNKLVDSEENGKAMDSESVLIDIAEKPMNNLQELMALSGDNAAADSAEATIDATVTVPPQGDFVGLVMVKEDEDDSRAKDEAESTTVCPRGGGESSCPLKNYVGALSRNQVERYSRHLLLSDGFGIPGQEILSNASVLVIGAGGIGSTVLLYLAASGIGTIGVVDFDRVESSNLHRQIIHSEAKLRMNKAESAVQAMRLLNPTVTCTAIDAIFTHENAMDLVSSYDCVVDASDNPKTRYLVNDACVLAGKPLVSGSAVGTEGQLTVYNHKSGPCYRCLYPNPPPMDGCKSCSDNGVLGPVPGLIGVLQSLEVMKVLTDMGETMHDRVLMYDALRCSFLRIKKPPRRKNCASCGSCKSIHSMTDSFAISNQTRGPSGIVVPVPLKSDVDVVSSSPTEKESSPPGLVLAPELSISCNEYAIIRESSSIEHVLLDVRVKQQFNMCSLKGSVNVPLEELGERLDEVAALCDGGDGVKKVFCLCRRGIASAAATVKLHEAYKSGTFPQLVQVQNITGGLNAWSTEVDKTFPLY